jgi:hypothetical protein
VDVIGTILESTSALGWNYQTKNVSKGRFLVASLLYVYLDAIMLQCIYTINIKIVMSGMKVTDHDQAFTFTPFLLFVRGSRKTKGLSKAC